MQCGIDNEFWNKMNFQIFYNLCGFPFESNISKTSARVSSGFQMQETFETTRPQVEHKMT